MILSCPSLTLRPLERKDLDQARFWVNKPDTASGLLRALPVSEIEQENWFQQICTDYSRMVWAIDSNHEHVGNAGLYHIDQLNGRAELWCYVGSEKQRGRGLGGEAVELLIDYAFNGLRLNKVYVHVSADNQPALALYRGRGFCEEGRLVQEYFINGRYVDVIRLRLLAGERKS